MKKKHGIASRARFSRPELLLPNRSGRTAALRTLEWKELYALKHEFGLSIAGWLQRAKQCETISELSYLSMCKQFSAKGWRTTEPDEQIQKERPRLFEQLVYRALGEQYISESKTAELLGIPMMRFHKDRQLEPHDVVSTNETLRTSESINLLSRSPEDCFF